MSEVIKFKCESCGAALKLSDDKDTAVCEYCGSEYVVRKQDPPIQDPPKQAPPKQAVYHSSPDNSAKQVKQPMQAVPPVRQIRKKSAWPNFIWLFILIMGLYVTISILNPDLPIDSKSILVISNIIVIIMLLTNTIKKNEIYKQMAEKPHRKIVPASPWPNFFAWVVYVVGFISSVLAAQDRMTLSLLGGMAGFGGVLIFPALVISIDHYFTQKKEFKTEKSDTKTETGGIL